MGPLIEFEDLKEAYIKAGKNVLSVRTYFFRKRQQILWSASNSSIGSRIDNAADEVSVHVIADVLAHGEPSCTGATPARCTKDELIERLWTRGVERGGWQRDKASLYLQSPVVCF